MLKFTIKMTPPRPDEEWEQFEKWFGKQIQAAHIGSVLQILECAVQWSRVDTGRFRGGWIGLANALNYPIHRSMRSPLKASSIAESEGMALSRVHSEYLRTLVENGVQYGGFLEENVGVFDQEGKSAFSPSPFRGLEDAIPFLEERHSKNMNAFLDNCAERLKKKDYPDDKFVDFGPPTVTD
jgi:hypothetical protein